MRQLLSRQLREHESKNTFDVAERWATGRVAGRGRHGWEDLVRWGRRAFLVQRLLVECPGSLVIGKRQLGLGQPEIIQVAHHTHEGVPP